MDGRRRPDKVHQSSTIIGRLSSTPMIGICSDPFFSSNVSLSSVLMYLRYGDSADKNSNRCKYDPAVISTFTVFLLFSGISYLQNRSFLNEKKLNSKSTLKTFKYSPCRHNNVVWWHLAYRGRNMTLDTFVMYDVNFIFQEIV